MADRPFVHLHCHTHYSLLDGASERISMSGLTAPAPRKGSASERSRWTWGHTAVTNAASRVYGYDMCSSTRRIDAQRGSSRIGRRCRGLAPSRSMSGSPTHGSRQRPSSLLRGTASATPRRRRDDDPAPDSLAQVVADLHGHLKLLLTWLNPAVSTGFICVGCGLDYRQLYRNLGYIAVLDPERG